MTAADRQSASALTTPGMPPFSVALASTSCSSTTRCTDRTSSALSASTTTRAIAMNGVDGGTSSTGRPQALPAASTPAGTSVNVVPVSTAIAAASADTSRATQSSCAHSAVHNLTAACL